MEKSTITTLEEANEIIKTQASQIEKLTNQLEWFQRQIFGSKSEKLKPIDAPMLPGFEPSEDKNAESTSNPVKSHERKKRESNGWSEMPKDLPREEVIIDVPESERDGMEFIGYEESERYARRETSFFIKVIKRAKYANPKDATSGVVIAPAAGDFFDSVSGKTKFDTSFVAGLVADKMENHLPLYRQAEMMKREGLLINRSTLQHLFAKCAIALEVLYNRQNELINECPIIHGDESYINLLQPGQGKCKKSYIWVKMTGTGPPMASFHFANSRRYEVAQELYKDYYGTIIHDQYGAYSDLDVTHAACWAHVRRKFFEAQNRGFSAEGYMQIIRQLYQIEQNCRANANKKGTEKALVSERKQGRILSKKLVAEFFELCKSDNSNLNPDNLLRKAINYALNCENDLSEFLRNPEVNIDNNPVENIIRPLALGRKNWLFAGSELGGKHLSILASFAVSCQKNEVNFRKYLDSVLPKLSTTSAKDIDNLLPHNWKKLQSI